MKNTIEHVKKHLEQLVEPVTTKEECTQLLHLHHPRVSFIKKLAPKAKVLDIGAGSGSLSIFKEWLIPKRLDIDMYAYSLEKGEYFERYKDYEIANWETDKPDFGGIKFDAIYSSHFIEHIENHQEFFDFCKTRLKTGGQLYLEFPSEHSLNAPTTKELAKIGISVMTGNFFDDRTHKHLPDGKKILERLENDDFIIQESGLIKLPLLENDVFKHFEHDVKDYATQMAYWSMVLWCRYLVALKN